MGSSPHAQGAHPARGVWQMFFGIIPACAGSTAHVSQSVEYPRDHPRMRGEHFLALLLGFGCAGSSPHARGARHRATRRTGRAGIIPACARSTKQTGTLRAGIRDHPRMRGEHSPFLTAPGSVRGASPHARGALVRSLFVATPSRIIPACAGSTPAAACRPSHSRDHPRMRGEHKTDRVHVVRWWGSSPHARGALIPQPSFLRRCGIIPACAGSTPTNKGY